jgi:hypothetical protein
MVGRDPHQKWPRKYAEVLSAEEPYGSAWNEIGLYRNSLPPCPKTNYTASNGQPAPTTQWLHNAFMFPAFLLLNLLFHDRQQCPFREKQVSLLPGG